MLEGLLRQYFVVGGMPEIVSSFQQNADMLEARRLQLALIDSYDSVFAKHAPGRILERMRLVFKSLPRHLSHENKKFVYGAVRPGARARDFEECLQWLLDYGAVHKVMRTSALRVPLQSYEDMSVFKLFGIDIGILGAMAGLNPAAVLDNVQIFSEFKGALAEQYVNQELVCMGYTPLYWSSEKGTAETDFCVEFDASVLPIEVKAGENLRSKSLRVACEKFSLNRALRTSLSAYRDEGWLVNIPLWAFSQFPNLIGKE